MYWADTIGGPAEVYRQISASYQRYGARWTPAPLLRRLAETGRPLRDAKPGRPM
jgi:3-hydroxyacyl-CoA dehydrogenase